MKFIEINKRDVIIALLLLLPERMLFLINRDVFQNLFRIEYSDFVVIVYFLLFVYFLIRYKSGDLHQHYFIINLLVILPLVVIASIVPHFLFGQSIYAGLWIQKGFIMLICSYYIARTVIIKNVLSSEYIWEFLYKLSFVVTGIIIIQHTISNYVHILDVKYSSRFGVRITDNFTYATILLIGSLTLFFGADDRRKKIKAITGLVMAYYHCVIISQTRIVMVAYGILTIIMAVFYRYSVIKKISILFIIIGIMLIVMQSELGQYFISAVLDSSTDPSAQIREIGKAYYIIEISKSPLFGRGYPHGSNDSAIIAAGMYDKIKLNDNGLYGFAYIYGILGLIWYVWISIKMFICSFKALKKGDYRFLLFLVFLQVLCVNIIWWYWRFSFGLIFTIMLAMMEEYHTKSSASKVSIYF